MAGAFAAVDVGVERGRVVVGRLDEARVSLQEVHRFPNPTARVDGTLRWNIQRLYGEILAGLGMAARADPTLASVAIDAWGMDFGLLDARGKLLGDPFHHRDRCTDGVPARLHGRVPEAELWAATGVQSTPIRTLHQLYAMCRRRSSTLHRAARLLLIPDLLGSWLCGVDVAEHTIASTTQCYDLERRAWTTSLLGRAKIPMHLFPPVVSPATVLGPLGAAPRRRARVSGVQVVAAAGHAAASAVASIPAEPASLVCFTAGPSSLVGTVISAPVRTEAAWRLGLTNAAGVDGTVWLHREVAGLGISQDLGMARARAGEALDDARAAGARARFGLAMECRRALRALEALLGRRLERVHMVGEGARNAPLCQLTADACGRPLLAGPVEAAALGNVLAQAVATGACSSWQEARSLAKRSFTPRAYEPRNAAVWQEVGPRTQPLLEAVRLASG